jgi:hypothetical protein
MTIFEFQRDVMIPLNGSIRQRPSGDGQTNAEMLNNQFRAFSQGVGNLYGSVSNTIEELDNFRLSQLLSLCRDISELYNLNVFAQMPSFIADNNLLDANPEDPEPLRYVAPGVTRGRFRRRTRDRPHRDAELAFAREVLGPIGERAFKNSRIALITPRMALTASRFSGMSVEEVNNSGLSIPFFSAGKIWLGENQYDDPMADKWGRYLLIHELFHQVQYLQGVPLARLISEVIRHNRHADLNVYEFRSYLHRDTLSDLPHYESQASLVGFFAQYYYEAYHEKIAPLPHRKTTIKDMARILEDSGIISTATRWARTGL